jgi:hypothetical protein
MELVGLGYEYEDWIKLAQDRVQWQAFLNVIVDLRVS